MSSAREVHEVLEQEYVSMYGPLERVSVAYGAAQITDVHWVLTILRACELADDLLSKEAAKPDAADAKELLARRLNGIISVDPGVPQAEQNRLRLEQRTALGKLIRSPALTNLGRTLIEQYDELFDGMRSDSELRELHRRITDGAFEGAVEPLRDLRLARLYQQLHARAQEDSSKARSALCISGGGARSATFALGVMQGLASAKILDKFDYLSTVAGGGYAGSWLSSWARRHPHGMSGVQEDLAAADPGAGWVRSADDPMSAPRMPAENAQKIEPDPAPVQYLRTYIKSQAAGLLSAETWTDVALYTRNLFLNLLVVVPIITAFFGLPRLYAFLASSTFWVADWLYPAVAVICLFLAFRYIGMHRPVPYQITEYRGRNADWEYVRGCIVPLLGAATAFTLYWADVHAGFSFVAWPVIAGAMLAAMAATIWPYLVYYRRFENAVRASIEDSDAVRVHVRKKKMRELIALLIGLVVVAVAVSIVFGTVFHDPLQNIDDLIRIAERAPGERAGTSLTPWAPLYLCFAVPAVLLALYVCMTIFVGISSHRNEDNEREWWARGGAWLLITAVTWIAVSAIGVFGPVALYHTPVFLKSAGGIAGVVTAVIGFSGKTPFKKYREQASAAGRAGYAVLGLATPLVALFFIVLISLSATGLTFVVQRVKPDLVSPKYSSKKYALDATLKSKVTRKRPSREHAGVEIVDESAPEPRVSMPLLDSLLHYRIVTNTEWWEIVMLLMLAALAWLVSRSIGSNKFSMHALYRNRLVRTYLGATRYAREPHPFTGFDERDDLALYQLRPELLTTANLRDPAAFFDVLKEGSRKTELGTAGLAPGRRKLAQHLWLRFSEATRRQIQRGRVDRDSIDIVIRNLNALLMDENASLEDVPDLGLTADFWALRREHAALSHPAVLRNRAVLDHFFPDVITPMARPKDAPAEWSAFVRADETSWDRVGGQMSRGPLHIINATVNVVSGEKLAWRQRTLLPFTMSAYDAGSVFLGYRDARLYGGKEGVFLGTAMTISGAAASPDMGYHSSPAMGFLLTLFNVRLGWWLGNPGPAGERAFRSENPRTLLGPMLSEMTGRNTDRYEWVYLSDGGHFDNLGLYEMILRRCHFIVLCDASADPQFTFEDLGNAVRRIRADLGVPIDLEEMFMAPRGENGEFPDGRSVATATIRYSAVDGRNAKDGLLVYLKPGIYNDENVPIDVINHARESRTFPHESTGDRSFSDAQFESYRALGRHVINDICMNYPDRESTARPRIPITKQFRSVAHFADFVDARARASRAANVKS